MVGSFRRGPLRYSNRLEAARTGFQATVSRGAAIDRWGRMVMALMGTVCITLRTVLSPMLAMVR